MDFIDHILGSPYYEEQYSPKALRDAVLGPHSLSLVKVSRHYMLLRPPVVVDFQQKEAPRKFMPEAKRRWFAGRATVYVPVFCFETLSADQFRARLREARLAMEWIASAAREDAALKAASEADATKIDIQEARKLDQLALDQLRVEIRSNPNLRGASKARRLALIRRQLAKATAWEMSGQV